MREKLGFNNLSIDLMFGFRSKRSTMMQATLDAALKLDLQHYSIYGLKGGRKYACSIHLFKKNQLPLPDEDEEVHMYVLIMERLAGSGLYAI